MTREEAIKVLRTESIELGGAAPSVCLFLEALDMAVKALEDDNHFRGMRKKEPTDAIFLTNKEAEEKGNRLSGWNCQSNPQEQCPVITAGL